MAAFSKRETCMLLLVKLRGTEMKMANSWKNPQNPGLYRNRVQTILEDNLSQFSLYSPPLFMYTLNAVH